MRKLLLQYRSFPKISGALPLTHANPIALALAGSGQGQASESGPEKAQNTAENLFWHLAGK
jgi:hypothetical protein